MECLLSRTHVIAATFWGNVLLVGEGDRVYAYCLETLNQVGCQTAFTTSNVHGIRIVGKSVPTCAVFGSRFLTVMTAEVSPSSSVMFKVILQPVMFDDWIWDVAWLQPEMGPLVPGTNFRTLALCLGHNRVAHWDWQAKQVLALTSCSDYCLLYTAQLVGVSWKQLIAVVGTVYKEVLLWVPSQVSPAPVLHRLTGHQGVIFSVSFHVPQRLLCSTSDDRSLRVYRFHEAGPSNTLPERAGTSSATTHSGTASLLPFGPAQLASGWFSSVHALYGHESRVWRAAILHNCYISVGEDGHICFWGLPGNLINRMTAPGGGSIWCLAVNEEETLAVTGSSGSALSLWHVPEGISQSNKTTWIEAFKDGGDFPRNLAILNTCGTLSLIVSTNEGRLLRWSLGGPAGGKREELFRRDYLASYNVLAVSPSRSYFALGGIKGHVAIIRCGPGQAVTLCSEWQLHEGRVHSIRWVSDDPPAYLSSGPNGVMVLSRVPEEVSGEDPESVDLYATCALPRGRQRWATAALYCSTMEALYVGDRCGSIHGFYIDEDEELIEPFRTYVGIHGNNGVTDIQQQSETLVTAGRDGRVLLYSLKNRDLHYLRVFWSSTTLEWIGHVILQSNGLLLCGYHMSDFVLWSTWQQRAVFQLNCGGGHRSWDFAINAHEGLFACLKTGRIMVQRCSLKEVLHLSCIRAPLHKKKIAAICLLFTEENASGVSQSYIATAGEDNIITISQLYQEHTHLVQRVACRLYGHISSVKALACCRPSNLPGQEERLLASVGGRAQLCLWRISASRQCSLTSEELHDHRLWSLDRPQRNAYHFPSADPLARYLDVCIWEHGSSEFRVATAASDALIRLFRYHWAGPLDILMVIPAGQHCLFRVIRIPLPQSINQQLTQLQRQQLQQSSLLLSSGNDGLLRFWKLESSKCDLIGVFRRHQSGINALDVYAMQDRMLLVVTGGDDNALILTNYLITEESSVVVLEEQILNSAHSTQITEAAFLRAGFTFSVRHDDRICKILQSGWLHQACLLLQEPRSAAAMFRKAFYCQEKTGKNNEDVVMVVGGEGLDVTLFAAKVEEAMISQTGYYLA
ncbi:tRNA (34-2'-O)-methyltransferase regulator WDR6 isoform X5 [Rhipicephalus microplus]|uniref:tRNA (34-2'-O)-methyltransferase regulator WDR6 isoform X5 n=1 Tax=Rhipicephalus microplus TaxID=6941 RepID=UPI003F6C0461